MNDPAFGEAYWRKNTVYSNISRVPLSTLALDIAQNTLILAEGLRNGAKKRIPLKAEYFPSLQKIIAIHKILFPICIDASFLDGWSSSPPILDAEIKIMMKWEGRLTLERHLSNFIVSLCFLDDIELCKEAHPLLICPSIQLVVWCHQPISLHLIF